MNKKKVWLIVLIIVPTLLIALALIFIFSNKAICQSKGVTDKLTITQKYYIKHYKDDITKIIVYKNYHFSNKDEYNKLEHLLTQTITNYRQVKDVNVKASKIGNNYMILFSTNIKNLSKEDIQVFGLTANFEELKTNLENQGLICK